MITGKTKSGFVYAIPEKRICKPEQRWWCGF